MFHWPKWNFFRWNLYDKFVGLKNIYEKLLSHKNLILIAFQIQITSLKTNPKQQCFKKTISNFLHSLKRAALLLTFATLSEENWENVVKNVLKRDRNKWCWALPRNFNTFEFRDAKLQWSKTNMTNPKVSLSSRNYSKGWMLNVQGKHFRISLYCQRYFPIKWAIS